MSLSKDDLKWIIPGVVALALLVLACLPIAGCPACSGACAVVGSINGEKIVCGYCGDRRISPIRKAWLLWNRRGPVGGLLHLRRFGAGTL